MRPQRPRLCRSRCVTIKFPIVLNLEVPSIVLNVIALHWISGRLHFGDKFAIERTTNKHCEQTHTLTEYPIAVGHMNSGLWVLLSGYIKYIIRFSISTNISCKRTWLSFHFTQGWFVPDFILFTYQFWRRTWKYEKFTTASDNFSSEKHTFLRLWTEYQNGAIGEYLQRRKSLYKKSI